MSRSSSSRIWIESRIDRMVCGRDRHPADAVAEQRRHRREQHRRPFDLDAGLGDAEGVDPADLREQAEHLPEGEHDADQQHRDDDAVEARIGEEGGRRPAGRG